jgi:hypothetical protein
MDTLRNFQFSAGGVRLVLTDILLILGALIALTSLLVLWAKFVRKERRRHSSSSKPKVLVPVETPEEEEPANAEPGGARRRKFRKRRREHRGRNPTLAETGGLPPVRDQEPMNPTQ